MSAALRELELTYLSGILDQISLENRLSSFTYGRCDETQLHNGTIWLYSRYHSPENYNSPDSLKSALGDHAREAFIAHLKASGGRCLGHPVIIESVFERNLNPMSAAVLKVQFG